MIPVLFCSPANFLQAWPWPWFGVTVGNLDQWAKETPVRCRSPSLFPGRWAYPEKGLLVFRSKNGSNAEKLLESDLPTPMQFTRKQTDRHGWVTWAIPAESQTDQTELPEHNTRLAYCSSANIVGLIWVPELSAPIALPYFATLSYNQEDGPKQTTKLPTKHGCEKISLSLIPKWGDGYFKT